jgi:hypothetical protein
MHINFQTYRTIKRALAQVLHTFASCHAEQHLNTLTLLICGIVGRSMSSLTNSPATPQSAVVRTRA